MAAKTTLVGTRAFMNVSRHLVPLIICGGAGTRLWPASRKAAPKQFINLMGALSSFQETVLRVSDPELFAEPVVITNAHSYHSALILMH
jgi:mannose-1-phosphate guanylyltransferase/mannose-6-phosphate isomerase